MDICQAAIEILGTENAEMKAQKAQKVASAWRDGAITWSSEKVTDLDLPDRPARPEKPRLEPPERMPRRKVGGLRGRVALLHSIAHIELNAIDLAFDIIARFSYQIHDELGDGREFVDDWVKVGDDEGRHFEMISSRLQDFKSFYGELPAHDGLWEAAMATSETLIGRLAIVPMVLEARGLDVCPVTIEKLRAAGDESSADLMDEIYMDEISHVAAGTKWFHRLCEIRHLDPETQFYQSVKSHFKGILKAPFNEPARRQAGLLPNLYEPLSC